MAGLTDPGIALHYRCETSKRPSGSFPPLLDSRNGWHGMESLPKVLVFCLLERRERRNLTSLLSSPGNPSGGNKLRGLYNITLKSLGASVKRDPEVLTRHLGRQRALMQIPLKGLVPLESARSPSTTSSNMASL
jgi:hypothetical protein